MARSRAFTLCFSRYFSPLCLFCVFSGSKGLGSKKVHFEAIWSIFGHGLDSLSMKPRGWTNLKALYALEDTKQWP